MSTTPTPEDRQAFAAAYEAAMADFGHPASDLAPSVGCGRHPENPACTCDVVIDTPTPIRYELVGGRYIERDFDLRKLVDIDALVDSVHGLVNRVPQDGGWTAADDVLSGLALLGAATDTAGAFHAHHELAELMERVARELDDDSA